MPAPPVVLSIAGYDPSSGAGITADIKTAVAVGCYCVTCITALTVQSTQGVFGVQLLEPELVRRTLEALADDVDIAAVRIGMLGSAEVAATVGGFLDSKRLPNVVLDPVIRSSSGTALLDEAGVEVLRGKLIPHCCDVITPNVDEAAALSGLEPIPADTADDSILPHLRRLSAGLHQLGVKAVVITGGHLRGADDYLSYRLPAGKFREEIIPGGRIESCSTHGTGCAFAMALACQLALGKDLPKAAWAAKRFVRKAIQAAYPLGRGVGPVNPFG
jgi:hydroxymethylpyrimidine/phosphomethylpyrimidine kinase